MRLPGVPAAAAAAAAVVLSIRDEAEAKRLAAGGVIGADVEAVSYVEDGDLGVCLSGDVME